ncbi:MAG: pilus assembly protein [Alphaproteobacteria bacterium]|nr:pilus assembly protein [Hyphomonas sp.]MBR9808113.1 pilus assembly protein [Alphaproteobacteria bacterium]|tara:strand:- start:1214 stop:1822 length:609 start_codon:yes stop_codon:yes gene_type:complete
MDMAKKSLLSRLNPRLKWRGVRGIRYNEKGVSAVEFALIAPILILLYLGAVELSLLMRVDRRVTSTSSSLGDLTARLAKVTDDDMREMFAAADVMMQPYSARTARMRITSIVDNGDGNARVAWSDAYLMTPYSKGTILAVPDGIISSPGSVIFSEVEYNYDGALGGFLTNDKNLRSQFYLRPRRVREIERVSGGGSVFGPTS